MYMINKHKAAALNWRPMQRTIIATAALCSAWALVLLPVLVNAYTGTLSTDLYGSTRNWDTTYQNTGTEDMWVSIFSENDGASGGVYVRVDSNSAHVTGLYDADYECGNTGRTDGINSNAWFTCVVVVPPNYYYRASEAGSMTRVWWNEYITPEMAAGGGGASNQFETQIIAITGAFLLTLVMSYKFTRQMFYV